MLRTILLIAIVLTPLANFAGEEKEYTPAIPTVKVNGETVPPESIKKIFDFWLKVYKAPGKPLSNDLIDKLASISLNQAIQHIAVRQYIDKNKLALPPDALKEDFEAFKADLTVQGKNFADVLKSRDKTEEEFLVDFALRAAMTRALRAETEKDLEPIKKAFEKEKEKLGLRRASQIRFSYEKTKYTAHPERTEEEAKKEADHALERARKDEDFTTLAKELSDETVSRDQGGDLGWIAPSYVPKQVVTALYALEKTGDVADLVKSEQGYHVIKMTDQKSEEKEFQAFLKQRVYIRTMAEENKLSKDATIEVEKLPEAPKSPLKPLSPDATKEAPKK